MNGTSLDLPWVGGLNNPQFSSIDFNEDGKNDLFIFDKSGNIIIPIIQHGAASSMDFTFEPYYIKHFPNLKDWVLLRDYNCDGYQDIFTYSSFGPGAMVYVNNGQSGMDWYSIADSLLYSHYELGSSSGEINIFIITIDIPAIYDIDDDGDLDIFTYQLQGSKIEFHKNFSMENEEECGLEYELKNRCWGYFAESNDSEEILLGQDCFNVNDPQISNIEHHSGSTLLMLDINNDGFKELVMGDVSYSSLTTVINGGPGNIGLDSITSVDYFFPNEDEPLVLNNFPASFYVDVNNDDINDFIVAPNKQFSSDNVNSVIMYLNEGENDAPDLVFEESAFLQKDMIDVGEGAYPVIVDVDQDGLMDILIGNRKKIIDSVITSSVSYLRNTGSISNPSFDWTDNDIFDLSTSGIGEAFYLTFMDLDGDNSLDMIVGNLNGELYYLINASNENEEFDFPGTPFALLDDANSAIDVGQLAKPFAFDLNEDGLIDLIIGERSGRINYYENTGSSTNPEFTLITDTLGGVLTPGFLLNTGLSSPFFYHQDGEIQMITGSETGEIQYFDNISGNLTGTFSLFDGPASDFNEGKRTAIARYDFNNDGLADLLIGNYRGGISYFKGDINSAISEQKVEKGFILYPNPANDHVKLSFINDAKHRIDIFNHLGQIIYSIDNIIDNEFDLKLSEWKNGQYIIRIGDGINYYYNSLLIIH